MLPNESQPFVMNGCMLRGGTGHYGPRRSNDETLIERRMCGRLHWPPSQGINAL